MGKSFSKNAKNSFAPAPESSATDSDAAAFTDDATAGSCASYADSSAARSVGLAGGLGTLGVEKGLTTPTCASFAWGKRKWVQLK